MQLLVVPYLNRWVQKKSDSIGLMIRFWGQKMGKWAKSARVALRARDYIQAGDFFKLEGSYRSAVTSYLKGNHIVEAARLLEQTGKPKKAEKLLRKYKVYKELAEFLIRNQREIEGIDILQSNGFVFEAAEMYEKIHQLDAAAHLYLGLGFHEKAGKLFTRARNFEHAIKAMKLAIEHIGEDSNDRTLIAREQKMKEWLANLYVGAKQFQNAGELFAELLNHELAAKCFAKAGTPLKSAAHLLKAGQMEKAKDILERESSPEARIMLGRIYLEQKELDKAIECLRDSDEHTLLSEAFEQLGQFQEAARHLEKSGQQIRAAAYYAKAHEFKRAAFIYEEQACFLEAAECYEKIENYFHAANLYHKAKNHFKTGECLFRAGKINESLPFLQIVDELEPEYPTAKRYMAEIFFNQGDFNISAKLFEELISKHGFGLNEANMDIYYRLARSLESQKKFDEGLQYYERIYTRKADYLDTRERMRSLSLKLGKADRSAVFNGPLTAKDLQKNQIIADRFRIDEEIGKGGMGYIFKVWDISLGRTVALKMLIHSKGNLEELKAELITARDLTHPYIIKVFDIGQWRDVSYFTMELVEGSTLKKYVEENEGKSFQDKLQLIIHICEGIRAAHLDGVIHRDLKPQNIIVTADGTPKILDFGIARKFEGKEQKQGVSGSPKYMAPEQILNEDMDPRTDIYALGIIMFYLFTGEEPFVGKNANEILLKQINQPLPDPQEAEAEIPFWLVEILKRCCNKNKEMRYSSIDDLIAELQLNTMDFSQ